MKNTEEVRYYILDGRRFISAIKENKPYLLENGKWFETFPIDDLSKNHKILPLDSGEIVKILRDYNVLRELLSKIGVARISRQLFLNRDAVAIAELLGLERRELPKRTKMRSVYRRLQSQPLVFVDLKENIEKDQFVEEGLTEGRIELLSQSEKGESKSVEAVCVNGMLSICIKEEGNKTEAFYGNRVCRYAYSLDKENTKRLHEVLKAVFPKTIEILQLCRKTFSGQKGSKIFKYTCVKFGIRYEYESK
jgi:hypothetical protein